MSNIKNRFVIEGDYVELDDGTINLSFQRLPINVPPAPFQPPPFAKESKRIILGEKDKMEATMKLLGQDQFYEGAWWPLALHVAWRATKDDAYWQALKDFVKIVIDGSVEIPIGQTHKGIAGPQVEGGATRDVYRQWPEMTSGPTIKAQMQWAMCVLHFLATALKNENDLTPSEREWALSTYRWIHYNIVEYWFAGKDAYGMFFYQCVDSAANKRSDGLIQRPGFWESIIMLCTTVALLDKHLRKITNLQSPDWSVIPTQNGNTHDPEKWFRQWLTSSEVDENGCRTWDVGNPNLQVGFGFGKAGEHKAPDTAHAARIPYMAQVWKDCDFGPEDVMDSLGKTFAINIAKPMDYVTKGGDFDGFVANVQQFANFIDGTDTIFRGYTDSNNSFQGTAGYAHTGWGWTGLYDAEARAAILRMATLIRENRALSRRDPRNVGSVGRALGRHGRTTHEAWRLLYWGLD